MDDLTINLIFILLFTCPGFLIQKFLQYVNEISRPEVSDFDKNIWAFFYSFLVFMLNFLFLMLRDNNYSYISEIVEELDSFVFVIKYLLLTGVNSCIVAVAVWVVVNRVFFEMKKKAIKERRRSILHSELTVWEDMARGRIDLIPNMSDLCVEIIKDGNIVTQGILRNFTDNKFKDFLLSDVEAIQTYLDNDKKTEKDEFKMFPKILAEYFNAETGYLMRIYSNEKIVEKFGKF